MTARATTKDAIAELTRQIAVLQERINALEKQVATAKEVALISQRVDHMADTRERWIQRAFMILSPTVAVLLGFYLGMKR